MFCLLRYRMDSIRHPEDVQISWNIWSSWCWLLIITRGLMHSSCWVKVVYFRRCRSMGSSSKSMGLVIVIQWCRLFRWTIIFREYSCHLINMNRPNMKIHLISRSTRCNRFRTKSKCSNRRSNRNNNYNNNNNWITKAIIGK